MEPPPPRQNAPKDGYGPRGYPDCYYTSRVLNSTFRYVKFIKKLRALEEEQRKGNIIKLNELKDKQYSDFFIRCDRRSLINNVARRVDLCLTSYQEDLKAKRQRLINLLAAEEEMNIRKFVEQTQAGAEALWQDKQDRLAYLLAKRQKEHEEKYKDTPLSKCSHVLPCIVKARAEEAQQIQLYQIREKQAKKMAEKEFDMMWHEVAMKESEALAARMELDAIERLRRDHECLAQSDQMIAIKEEQRKRDQELLKQETIRMKELFDIATRKEDEAERQRVEKRMAMARERKDMIEERKATVAKLEAEAKLINDTWDSLAGMGLADQKAHEERRRQKERELDICNKQMMEIRKGKDKMEEADNILLVNEAKRLQDIDDQKRCQYITKMRNATKMVRADIVEQMKENEATREAKKHENDDYLEYQQKLFSQLEQLVKHKELTEAQARKLHQTHLQQQIDYNKLLKDRALQEELEQRKKCQLATEEYQQQIKRMLCRPFFSDEVHPFMKQMCKDLKMQEKCPCSRPDYCAAPVLSPTVTPLGKPAGSPGVNPTASSSK